MSRELTPQEIAERSLIKTYRKSIWNPFIAAVKRYELVSPGDKIAVCISGGKDSVMLAKLMQELQRHTDRPFELAFMVMDPGYKPENRKLIEDNVALLGIPITIFDSDIFNVTVSAEKIPVISAPRMRRGFLYAKAPGAWLQQDRTGAPFFRRCGNNGHGPFLRRTAAGHAAEAPQQKLPRYGADSAAVLRT